jgi:hypothetical protein
LDTYYDIGTDAMTQKKSIKEIRETRKNRQARFRQYLKERGYRQITTYLPQELIDTIKAEAEKNDSTMHEQIEKALTFVFSDESLSYDTKNEPSNGINSTVESSDSAINSVLTGIKKRQEAGEKYSKIRNDICMVVDDMKKDGLSFDDIADELNQFGIKPQRKDQWESGSLWQMHHKWFKKNS